MSQEDIMRFVAYIVCSFFAVVALTASAPRTTIEEKFHSVFTAYNHINNVVNIFLGAQSKNCVVTHSESSETIAGDTCPFNYSQVADMTTNTMSVDYHDAISNLKFDFKSDKTINAENEIQNMSGGGVLIHSLYGHIPVQLRFQKENDANTFSMSFDVTSQFSESETGEVTILVAGHIEGQEEIKDTIACTWQSATVDCKVAGYLLGNDISKIIDLKNQTLFR